MARGDASPAPVPRRAAAGPAAPGKSPVRAADDDDDADDELENDDAGAPAAEPPQPSARKTLGAKKK